MKRMILAGIMVLMAGGVALALQDGEAAAAAATEGKIPDGLKGILTGILGGAIAVFIGWGKNRNAASGEMEKFDVKYAWPTLIIGAIVGLISYWMGMAPKDFITSMEASPLFAGAVFALEAVWKAIWRNSVPLVRDAIGAIKAGGNPTPPAPPPPQ